MAETLTIYAAMVGNGTGYTSLALAKVRLLKELSSPTSKARFWLTPIDLEETHTQRQPL